MYRYIVCAGWRKFDASGKVQKIGKNNLILQYVVLKKRMEPDPDPYQIIRDADQGIPKVTYWSGSRTLQ